MRKETFRFAAEGITRLRYVRQGTSVWADERDFGIRRIFLPALSPKVNAVLLFENARGAGQRQLGDIVLVEALYQRGLRIR